MIEQDLNTVEMMETYGGGFVKALATAARHADSHNLRLIKSTWPDYWREYSEMAYLKMAEKLDWGEAQLHLETVKRRYKELEQFGGPLVNIGPAMTFIGTLERKFESGERSLTLHESIMKLE